MVRSRLFFIFFCLYMRNNFYFKSLERAHRSSLHKIPRQPLTSVPFKLQSSEKWILFPFLRAFCVWAAKENCSVNWILFESVKSLYLKTCYSQRLIQNMQPKMHTCLWSVDGSDYTTKLLHYSNYNLNMHFSMFFLVKTRLV